MKMSTTTLIIIDVGILLGLLAVTFGLWFYPWLALVLVALFLLGCWLSGRESG
jgi:hypothetical protein